MTATLLATKLHVPPLRGEHVARPRLTGQLDLGRGCRLTLVSAPAGFGKTTLLSEWIRSQEAAARERPSGFAWLSLDREDNDPVRFWSYLVAALQTIPFVRAAGLGESMSAVLLSLTSTPAAAPLPWQGLLSGLINEITAIGRPFVLALDDLHLITEPQIHTGLTFLLENLPPSDEGMHLVVAGRSDPPWPLARLRARGQVSEVRVADLRFTLDETTAFLKDVMGFELSPDDITTLDARTEGWIAGLQMAALSMRGRLRAGGDRDLSSFVADLSGSHRYILDYLVEEVLDQQPPEVQEFLLKTSVLERLSAPLCDGILQAEMGEAQATTGRSQSMLERLEAANLFLLALDDERRWYRYHPLFADLLRRRLAQRVGPAGVTLLHLRASQWYEQSDLTVEALSHALASGDAERLGHLVERNALAALYQGHRATVVHWLEALPDALVRSRPWLCVAYAWVMASSGRWDMVESLLSDAERASGLWDVDRCAPDSAATPSRRSQDPLARRMAGHFLALQAYMTAVKGDVETARELARSALSCVPQEDRAIRSFTATLLGSTLRLSGDLAGAARVWTEALAESRSAGVVQEVIVLLGSLASLLTTQGQLRKAFAASRQILDLAREQAGRGAWTLPLLGTTHCHLSRIHLEWNDLPAALDQAQEGVRLSEAWGHLEALATGYAVLARVLQATGDAEGALAAMRKAGEQSSRLSAWYSARIQGELARLWLAQGNLDAVASWAQDSRLTEHDELSFDRLGEYLTLARVLVARGKAGEALVLLSRLLNAAEAAGALVYVVEVLVIKAVALRAQGSLEDALSSLTQALAIAQPEGYVRTFIGEGDPLVSLLRQVAARGIAPEYVSRLLEAHEAAAAGQKQAPEHAAPPPARVGRVSGAGREGAAPRPPMVEPLSERELEVLRLLDTSLTVPEIAERLVVSASTVRSHVKSIYGKLDAHNRLQALECARELKLLS